ncbi:RPM1-interacting protein 4-like [Prosopis cineraria]|uniref:RPM1-interacting protein 4-like n=1 Tax=Prosopis cineraria TaxID=364024 RepID=UPI00240EC152|nr:RPM1-interacting protein 4-like [Prosopis cineraria]
MAQRSHVPRFGNWENEDNVPYTAYFEKARKDRTGSMTNPNVPEGNPDSVHDNSSSSNLPPTEPMVNSEDQSGKGSVSPALELQKSKDDAVPKPFTDSPASHDNMGNRSGNESTHRRGVGSADTRQKPARQSAGPEYSIERSPLHRLAKTPGRDSPSLEGKNSYDSSHGTPGRSRLRTPHRGDESPDKAAAVPKFGEWDDNDPASADGFTQLFNKVREEKAGSGQPPGTPTQRPYAVRNQKTNEKGKSCCFGWCK